MRKCQSINSSLCLWLHYFFHLQRKLLSPSLHSRLPLSIFLITRAIHINRQENISGHFPDVVFKSLEIFFRFGNFSFPWFFSCPFDGVWDIIVAGFFIKAISRYLCRFLFWVLSFRMKEFFPREKCRRMMVMTNIIEEFRIPSSKFKKFNFFCTIANLFQ